jgi:Holliday junction resolvase RusA-like endonuclease
VIETEVVLTLTGTAVGKGSLKCVGRNGGHRLIEDNPHTQEWRDRVAAGAVEVAVEAERYQPIGVEITTTLARPAGHYGTGRNSGQVRPSAPVYPTASRTGDVDKLARLVLDALEDAGLLTDDAQVVEVTSRKAYPDDAYSPDTLDDPGVRVRVYPIEVPAW